VVRSLGDSRPAWKVLRVLCDLLDVGGASFESTRDVLASVPGLQMDEAGATVRAGLLDNRTQATVDLTPAEGAPVVAAIYQLDGLVRRAPSLQMTADGRLGFAAQEVAA
jgi:NADH-quinone oxidoreductase subunit G